MKFAFSVIFLSNLYQYSVHSFKLLLVFLVMLLLLEVDFFPVFHVLTILPFRGAIVNIFKTSLSPKWQWGLPLPPHHCQFLIYYLNLHLLIWTRLSRDSVYWPYFFSDFPILILCLFLYLLNCPSLTDLKIYLHLSLCYHITNIVFLSVAYLLTLF